MQAPTLGHASLEPGRKSLVLRKVVLDGLAAFAAARAENLARLGAIAGDAWNRRGTQDGVGEVSLCDMPVFMAQHDAAHRAEIDAARAASR